LKRAYYSNSIKEFLKQDELTIFGEIVSNDQFSAQDLQKNTWKREIEILKRELSYFESGYILFEYTIPRIGNRIDNVFIYKGIIFLSLTSSFFKYIENFETLIFLENSCNSTILHSTTSTKSSLLPSDCKL